MGAAPAGRDPGPVPCLHSVRPTRAGEVERAVARRETALHACLARLREVITEDFKPGDRLPNERELATLLQASRNTVREALGLLAAEGVVVRNWGVGTFVLERSDRVPVSLGEVIALRDRISAAGRSPTLQDASVSRLPCPDGPAASLRVDPGTEVWCVDRLFAADNTPAAWIVDYLPLQIQGRRLDPGGLVSIDVDLIKFVSDQTGGAIHHTELAMDAVLASGDAVTRLRVKRGHPLINARQTWYTADNSPLFHGMIRIRTDVLTYHITRVVG